MFKCTTIHIFVRSLFGSLRLQGPQHTGVEHYMFLTYVMVLREEYVKMANSILYVHCYLPYSYDNSSDTPPQLKVKYSNNVRSK